MSFKSGIILLSGGLDCLGALSLMSDKIGLALTFDYGQDAFLQESKAAERIADFYGIKHKIIKLDWFGDLYKKDIPSVTTEDLDNSGLMQTTAQKVWIPNRNAVFINIAAAFADGSDEYDTIVIGANREEAQTFSDNSEEFIKAVNKSLQYSANTKVEVTAPVINMNKSEIIRIAKENGAPLEYVYSCYRGGEKHCGTCESCKRLQRAVSTLDENESKRLKEIYFEVCVK